jgi:hypothetical protein
MMAFEGRSKREHCPKCDSVQMHNYVLVRPGEDVDIFVECGECGTFVCRYTLKSYTCDDPYRSYLRQMRDRTTDSGSDALKKEEEFSTRLWENYRAVKDLVAESEETADIEDLLNDIYGGD